MTALAEGLALRAVARLLTLDKDTLSGWLSQLSEHCTQVVSYFFRTEESAATGSTRTATCAAQISAAGFVLRLVVKERERGRVVNITTRIVYGTEEQIRTALHDSPVSRAINTYGVERNNLTVRQHSLRLGRNWTMDEFLSFRVPRKCPC